MGAGQQWLPGFGSLASFDCQLLPATQWRGMLKLPLGFVERNSKIHSISYILSMWQTNANCSGSSLRKCIAWDVEGYVCFRTPFAAGQGHMSSLGPQVVNSVNMFHFTAHMHLSIPLLYNCGKPLSLKIKIPQDNRGLNWWGAPWRRAALERPLEPWWNLQGWEINDGCLWHRDFVTAL